MQRYCKEYCLIQRGISEIEITMRKLSVEVKLTPKAHCKLEGRGLENLWGVSKISYC